MTTAKRIGTVAAAVCLSLTPLLLSACAKTGPVRVDGVTSEWASGVELTGDGSWVYLRLAPAGDVGALRGAVEWMLGDAGRRSAVAGTALERIVPMFIAGRMVAELERVYEEALRCARDGRRG